jgi:Hydrazine synthase alpha subunit middle domain/WD40-like Beta Propeller Repeat
LFRKTVNTHFNSFKCRLILALSLIIFFSCHLQAATPDYPIIYTRVPLDAAQWFGDARAEGMITSDFYEGAQLVLLTQKEEFRVFTPGFQSACDPDVSFDGKRVLFSGKKKEQDNWNIFEADLAGGSIKQITSGFGNCRSPKYMSTFYTIVAPGPWYTLTFTSDESNELSEYGKLKSTNIYSCKLDGTGIQRLTYNPSHDFNPMMMQDGRILYSSWQRNLAQHGNKGRINFFSINSDGTDVALFNRQGKIIKHMAAITPDDLVVFIENDSLPWDGAGTLGGIETRRFLKSYRPITAEPGLYHSPSPLPDGRVLVSRRPADNSGNHDVFILEPKNGTIEPIISDQRFHLLQAVAVVEKRIPDGRSSVVNEKDPNGQFFCLDIRISDDEKFSTNIMEDARKVRFIEGVPGTSEKGEMGALLNKRILGEAEIKPDGSFFAEVPANIPVKVQIIDDNGMSLKSGSWIWVRNHEPRGCIGCHEDPELVPQNRMVDAVTRKPLRLTMPPARRRTVSFHDNLLPVVEKHCSTASCHGEGSNHAIYLPAVKSSEENSRSLYETLTAASSGKAPGTGDYVHPGMARTSPLIWHIMGKNTSKKWDSTYLETYNKTDQGPGLLTPEEIRMFIEWIDLGAHWKGPVPPEKTQAEQTAGR